jgi:hypothetical protein
VRQKTSEGDCFDSDNLATTSHSWLFLFKLEVLLAKKAASAAECSGGSPTENSVVRDQRSKFSSWLVIYLESVSVTQMHFANPALSLTVLLPWSIQMEIDYLTSSNSQSWRRFTCSHGRYIVSWSRQHEIYHFPTLVHLVYFSNTRFEFTSTFELYWAVNFASTWGVERNNWRCWEASGRLLILHFSAKTDKMSEIRFFDFPLEMQTEVVSWLLLPTIFLCVISYPFSLHFQTFLFFIIVIDPRVNLWPASVCAVPIFCAVLPPCVVPPKIRLGDV